MNLGVLDGGVELALLVEQNPYLVLNNSCRAWSILGK